MLNIRSRVRYKIGSNSPPKRESGPDLDPHPPTPHRGWGRYLDNELWSSAGERDHKSILGEETASVPLRSPDGA
jgi:hypothetical protein